MFQQKTSWIYEERHLVTFFPKRAMFTRVSPKTQSNLNHVYCKKIQEVYRINTVDGEDFDENPANHLR